MSTTLTTNLGLIKPVAGTNEPASIFTSHNPNMDVLDGHDHSSGKGLGVLRLQTGSAPVSAGQVQITGDTLKWWAGSAGAVYTAVSLAGAQTVNGVKTYSVQIAGQWSAGHRCVRLTVRGGLFHDAEYIWRGDGGQWSDGVGRRPDGHNGGCNDYSRRTYCCSRKYSGLNRFHCIVSRDLPRNGLCCAEHALSLRYWLCYRDQWCVHRRRRPHCFLGWGDGNRREPDVWWNGPAHYGGLHGVDHR